MLCLGFPGSGEPEALQGPGGEAPDQPLRQPALPEELHGRELRAQVLALGL